MPNLEDILAEQDDGMPKPCALLLLRGLHHRKGAVAQSYLSPLRNSSRLLHNILAALFHFFLSDDDMDDINEGDLDLDAILQDSDSDVSIAHARASESSTPCMQHRMLGFFFANEQST